MRPKKNFVVAFAPKQSLEDHMVTGFQRSGRRAPTLKDIQHIKGVRHTKQGIVLDEARMKSSIYFYLESISDAAGKHVERGRRVNTERLLIMKQLKSLGFGVFTPKYSFTNPEDIQRAKGVARSFKAKAPTEYVGNKAIAHSSAIWARDLWVKTRFGRSKKFLPMLEVNKFGEGGMVVPIGEAAFFVSDKLRNAPEVVKLAAKKTRFYFLKDGFEFDADLTKMLGAKTFVVNDHVDLFLGVVGKVMLVDSHFFEANKGVLKVAAKENKLMVVPVPVSEASIHPANFLVIGENRILVDRDAKETIALLKANGVDVIPTVVPLRANRTFGGGVRCMVNEL